jgi:hypothetical protein
MCAPEKDCELMRSHSLRHLSDTTLVDGLDKLVQQERTNVA